jgi:hypothetical protein
MRLAMLLARQWFGNVFLITDRLGERAFDWPEWTAVLNSLDAIPDDLIQIWGLGKVYSAGVAAEIGRPFLHLDWDAFIWKQWPADLLGRQILMQSAGHPYSAERVRRLLPNPAPELFLKPPKIFNSGVFGGSDTEFWRQYTDAVIKCVFNSANRRVLSRTTGTSVVLEEWMMTSCALARGLEVSPVVDSPADAVRLGFTHLMGSKNEPGILARISERLRSGDLTPRF